jgi:hypothetical protein
MLKVNMPYDSIKNLNIETKEIELFQDDESHHESSAFNLVT